MPATVAFAALRSPTAEPAPTPPAPPAPSRRRQNPRRRPLRHRRPRRHRRLRLRRSARADTGTHAQGALPRRSDGDAPTRHGRSRRRPRHRRSPPPAGPWPPTRSSASSTARWGTSTSKGAEHRDSNVGDSLRVMAGQSTLAELEVVYAAEHSASCRVVSETRPVRAGDQALKVTSRAAPPAVAVAAVVEAPVAPAPSATGQPASRRHEPTSGGAWGRLRGGASFGYYRSWDETDSGLDFQQRTGRVDLGIQDIARPPAVLHAARAQPAGHPRPHAVAADAAERAQRPALRGGPALRAARGQAPVRGGPDRDLQLRRGGLPRRRHRAPARAAVAAGRRVRRSGRQLRGLRLRERGSEVRCVPAPGAGRALRHRPLRHGARLRARERRRRREPRVREPREPLRQRQPLVAVPARRARREPWLAQGR